MATDTHIKFDGVDGESSHKDHKGETKVESWHWSVNNASAVMGGGSGQGAAEPGILSFTHLYDKSSPVLAKRCADGKHFPTVVLTARKAGEGQKDFLKVTLKEAKIVSVHPSGTAGGDISETVSVSYGDIEFAYKAQDAQGGTGGEVKFGWNVKETSFR